MIDTHSHIYAQEFDEDIEAVILRAKQVGVHKIILPNVDMDSLPRTMALSEKFPDYCFPTLGLHPTSVNETYLDQLHKMRLELEQRSWIAIGEIGIDLYWDKTFFAAQVEAFKVQIEWALEFQLPIIIHTRNSIAETLEVLMPYKDKGLKGVFHCFSGTATDAQAIIAFGGFVFGVGGVLTFKNSDLASVLANIPLDYLVLETDAPYLAPVPYRGKRNEPAYIQLVAEKLGELYTCSVEKIIEVTTNNANKLFYI